MRSLLQSLQSHRTVASKCPPRRTMAIEHRERTAWTEMFTPGLSGPKDNKFRYSHRRIWVTHGTDEDALGIQWIDSQHAHVVAAFVKLRHGQVQDTLRKEQESSHFYCGKNTRIRVQLSLKAESPHFHRAEGTQRDNSSQDELSPSPRRRARSDKRAAAPRSPAPSRGSGPS